MKFLYYPGCTIKRNAPEYEKASLAILKMLGMEAYELERWYCCGVVFSLASDDLMRHLGAVRTLIKAQELSRKVGTVDLLTLCPMCFNVLRRVNNLLRNYPDKLETISLFMNEEERYRLAINVYHILEVLGRSTGKIKDLVKRRLSGVKVVPYYGCTLLRPKEVAIDNPEDPRIMEDLIELTGASLIDYPFKSECCGSYHVLTSSEVVINRCRNLIVEASERGANVITTPCPLCKHNLEVALRSIRRVPDIRVMYVTELLAYSLGLELELAKELRDYLTKLTGTSGGGSG